MTLSEMTLFEDLLYLITDMSGYRYCGGLRIEDKTASLTQTNACVLATAWRQVFESGAHHPSPGRGRQTAQPAQARTGSVLEGAHM